MGFYNNSDGSSIVNGLSYVPRYKSHELSNGWLRLVLVYINLQELSVSGRQSWVEARRFTLQPEARPQEIIFGFVQF